jgi:CHAD domain-containing protein
LSEPDLLALPVRHAVRQHARLLVGRIAAAAERLEIGANGEALHDFRVALRRLRTFAKAYADHLPFGRKPGGRLRALAKMTGGPRDIEVALHWVVAQRPAVTGRERPGVDWLIERLKQEHEQAEARLKARALKSWKQLDTKLMARLDAPFADEVTAARFDLECQRVIEQHRQVLHKRMALADETRSPRDLHAARLAAKNLRYLMEPLRDSVPGAAEALRILKTFQDTFGELNDAHEMLHRLRDAVAGAAAERARERYDLELEEGRDSPAVRSLVRRDPRCGLMNLSRLAKDRLDALERRAGETYFAHAQSLLEPTTEVSEQLSAVSAQRSTQAQ